MNKCFGDLKTPKIDPSERRKCAFSGQMGVFGRNREIFEGPFLALEGAVFDDLGCDSGGFEGVESELGHSKVHLGRGSAPSSRSSKDGIMRAAYHPQHSKTSPLGLVISMLAVVETCKGRDSPLEDVSGKIDLVS